MERRPLFLGPKKYGSINIKATNDKENDDKEEVLKVENYQWKTVFGAVISIFVATAIKNSVKYAKDDISLAVHQPVEAIKAIGDIQMICFILSAPVAGLIINLKSSQAVGITGGLLMGFGIIITSFATDYLILLLGISVIFGIGYTFVLIGSFITANEVTLSRSYLFTSMCFFALVLGHTCPDFIYTSMLAAWEWRVMFRVLAVASLICVGGFVSVELVEVKEGERNKENARLDGIKILVYLYIMIADALMFLGAMIAYHNMIETQTLLQQSPNILYVTFLGNIALLGIIGDKHTKDSLRILKVSSLLASCLPFILVFSDSTGIFLTPSIILTSLISNWMMSTIPSLVTVLGVPQLGVAVGLMASTRGVVYMLCPWVEQTLTTVGQNTPMYLSGGVMMLAGVLYTLAIRMMQRKSTRNVSYQHI